MYGKVARSIMQAQKVSVDTETTGLNALQCRLKGVSLSWRYKGVQRSHYWSFDHDEMPPHEAVSRWKKFKRDIMEPLFNRRAVVHPFHNASFDLKVLKVRGLEPKGRIADTMIESYLLDETSPNSLDACAKRELGDSKVLSHGELMKEIKGIHKKAQDAAKLAGIKLWEYYRDFQREDLKLSSIPQPFRRLVEELPEKTLKKDVIAKADRRLGLPLKAKAKKKAEVLFHSYARKDADLTLRLHEVQLPKVQAEGFGSLYWNLYMKVMRVATEMEWVGIKVDVPLLTEMQKLLEKKIAIVKQQIAKMLGKDFNPGSPPQLKQLLWIKMQLDPPPWVDPKRHFGKDGLCSTGEQILEWIAENNKVPALEKILTYRKLIKTKSTYVDRLLEEAAADPNGRVHTSFSIIKVTSRWCVAENTELDTNLGTFEISKLDLTKTPNISILSHVGRWRRILRCANKGDAALFQVTLDNGLSITCGKGHGFQTPAGWRQLSALATGDCVSTFDKNCGRENGIQLSSKDIVKERVRAYRAERGFDPKADARKVFQFDRQYNCGEYEILSTPLCQTAAGSKGPKLPARDEGQRTRTERKTRGSASPQAVEEVTGQGQEFTWDCSRSGDERMVCPAEHSDVWLESERRTSFSNARSGSRLPRKTGNFFAGDHREGEKLFRGSARFLLSAVRGVRACERNGMVHQGPGQESRALEEHQKHSTGSYMLERESVGNTLIASSLGRKDHSYPRVRFSREVSGRLRVSGNENFSRVGWRAPSGMRNDAEAGRAQDKSSPEDRLQVSSFPKRRNPIQPPRCRQEDPRFSTARIAEIKYVGRGNIWDIEVEEDHSYVAHGFINHNSSQEPNLQNIPNWETLKKYIPDIASIRSAFIPSKKKLLLVADYSQIDARVMAHVTRDPAFFKGYREWKCKKCGQQGETNKPLHNCPFCKESDEGKFTLGADIHMDTAKATPLLKKYGKKEGRRHAKKSNFGALYLMGAKTLAQQTGLPDEEAKELLQAWHAHHPGIRAYANRIEEVIWHQGYFRLLNGQKRRFHRDLKIIQSLQRQHNEIAAKEASRRSYAIVREAMNNTGQGGAAVIINTAILYFWRRWKEMKAHGLTLLLQVHDELVFEVDEDKAEAAKIWVRDVMESAGRLDVPVLANAETGPTWETAK